jgi:hypothetical protein
MRKLSMPQNQPLVRLIKTMRRHLFTTANIKKWCIVLMTCGWAGETVAQTPSYFNRVIIVDATPYSYGETVLTLNPSPGVPTGSCPNGYPVWQKSGFIGTYKVFRDPSNCNKWIAELRDFYGPIQSNFIITATPTDNPPTSGWPTGFRVIAAYTCTGTPSSSPTIITKNPSTTINGGTSVTLTVNGCVSGNTVWWSDNSTDNPRIVTPSNTTTYSARCVDGTCLSENNAVITVNVTACSTPTAPTSITKNPSTAISAGTSVTLTANGCASGNTIKWDDNSVTNPRTVNPAVTTTYSAKCVNGTCESTAASVAVTVCTTPTAPTSITKNPNTTVSANTSVQLTANGCTSGNTIKWEDNSTTNPRTVTPSITTNYTAKCVSGTCESATTAVDVNVTGSISVSPLSQSSYCPNAGTTIPVTFSTSGTTGPYTIKLKRTQSSICIGPVPPFEITTVSTSTNSGTLTLPSTLTPSGSVANPSCPFGNTNTSYTISVTNGSVTSAETPVTIASSQSVTNLVATPANISTVGASSILSATCAGGTITWYNGASQLGTGPSITVTPSSTTTYTLTCVNSTTGCSANGSITVPLIVNLSGTGITNLTGDFKEVACTNCNTTNPYSYSKNLVSSSCGQYGIFTCTTENKIVRINNVWEINETYTGVYGAVTVLYYSKSAYNSQRPPCTATWIKVSDGSEMTLTMTGVCENASPIPCPPSLVLQSPPATTPAEGVDYDASNAIPPVIRKAAATTGSITATNKITGTANVTYEAKTVQLNPGFRADNGTVFKAQVGGCN